MNPLLSGIKMNHDDGRSGAEIKMSLTQCPNCHRRCFTEAASCASCFQIFQPGFLEAYAVAEERAFSAKASTLFLSLFVMSLAVLLFFALQVYLDGTVN